MKKMRGGFTIVELLIAMTLFSVLVILGMQVAFGSAVTVDTMYRTVSIDALGGRAIHELNGLLRSSILPYKPAVTGTGLGGGVNADGDYVANPNSFGDLDSKDYGFGGTNGKTWLSELKKGVDNIAFVVPIDAQGTHDVLDHNLHLQVGYVYNGISYLSASASGTPRTPHGVSGGFEFRGPGELVSALAALDPDKFNNIAFESIETPTLDEWKALEFGGAFSWPDVTCFMAIRYVPVMRSGTNPLEVREKGLLHGKHDVDLDGDGAMDGVFQIGRLQLVYTGGNDFYHVNNAGAIVRGPFAQKIRNLTPDVVLRRVDDPDMHQPIFRLIQSDSSPAQALAVEMLMLNAGDVDLSTGKITLSPTVKAAEAKRFKTSILLKNMAMR